MQLLRLANEDQTVIIDLLRAPFGLRSGWDTQTPPMGGSYTYEPYGAQFAFGNYQPLSETFELAIEGRCAAVRAAMDSLQDFLESTRLFHSGDLAAKSCWLEWQANGDEHPKRTLLYSGIFRVTSQENITPSMVNGIIVGRLTLSRHPLWECVPTILSPNLNARCTTIGPHSPISTLGGTFQYLTIGGNVPARIGTAEITPQVAAGLYRMWLGLRTENQGAANFEPIWECEDGTNGTDAADAADATASNGNKVTVTYVTTTLASRMTITVGQVCAASGHTDYNHQQGRYLVLLRCKLSAAGTSGIQMHSGYTGNILAEEIYIDNTNWRLIPIGNISISPWEGHYFSAAGFFQDYRIDIYAEQLAGGNLDLDCLVLIPNEHLLTLDGMPSGYVNAHTMEDDTEITYGYTAPLTVVDSVESGMTDWYVPPGPGIMVVTAEDQNQHDLGETIGLVLYCFTRWLLYRTD